MQPRSQNRSLQKIIEEENLCISRNARGTDKLHPHNYVKEFYEPEFENYKNRPIDLLEIGFRHGASLYLWHSYFENAQICGADNSSDAALTEENPINHKWLSSPNISTFFGDAYDTNFAKKISKQFDIIIDDGPHTISSQIIFLKLYLPKLKDGGVAIIEVLQDYGALCMWPLMLNTPLKYHVSLLDLRTGSGPHDDLLFVVRKKGVFPLGNRLIAVAIAVYLSAKEIAVRIFRRAKRNASHLFSRQ